MGDVTLDDLVGYMGDKSGNDNHAIQPTGTKRPTYKNDGTFHWLEFDGTDDYLQTTANIDVSQPEFWLFASGSATSGTTMFGLADTGSEDQALRLDRTQLFVRSEPSQINSITAAITGTVDDAVYSIRARQSDRTITIFRGGVQLDQVVAPGSDWFSSPAAMVLGAGKDGANASNYKDYGSLLIIDTLSDLAHVAVVDYLQTLTPWIPLRLFQASEQGAWYDPSDLTTLYQDSAGTTPVTADGDPVGRMEDKSGNGNHATQSVSAARPIYRTDGTLHWLEFDGVDDSIESAAIANGAFTGDVWMFMAGDIVTGTAGFFGLENSLGGLLTYRFDGDRSILRPDDATTDSATVSQDNTVKSVMSSSAIQSTRELSSWSDGVLSGSDTFPGGFAWFAEDIVINLGKNAASSGTSVQGNFYGGFIVSGVVSARASAESYLADKSGVTL